MAVLRLSLLVLTLIGFIFAHDCDERLTRYCACRQDPHGAMQIYEEMYKHYNNHIEEMRHQIRNNFGQTIREIKSQCDNLCKYLHNYEDVLITRCEHCLLSNEYQPFWITNYRKEEDMCAWIVIHGPVLCGQIHDHNHHDCDIKQHFYDTFYSIAAYCNGTRCQ